MKKLSVLLALALLFLAGSTAYAGIFCDDGSGNVISEDVTLKGSFNKVSLKGSGNIFVIQGNTESLKIETDDNLIDKILCEVQGSTLVIGAKSNICPTKLNFYVTLKDAEGFKVTGSGDVKLQNTIRADKLALVIRGSGDIKGEVECTNLKCDVSGSGDIDVSGRAANTKIEISGSGDVDAGGLNTNWCQINIFGSGDCMVDVKDELYVDIFGSGDVVYSGDPATKEVDVKGSGDVKRK